MIKHNKVRVRLSELHTKTRAFPPWEIPVLQAVHGDDAVKVVGNVDIDSELPDPALEYERLAERYPNPTGPTYVAQVYGSQGPGIARLAEAMERSGARQTPKQARATA
jgi:hypothetical protein